MCVAVLPDVRCMPSIVTFVQLVIARCESDVGDMRKKIMEMVVDGGSHRSDKTCCLCDKNKRDTDGTEEFQPAKKAKLDKAEKEGLTDDDKACTDLVIDEDTSSRTLSVDEEDPDAAKNVSTEECCMVADDVIVETCTEADLNPLETINIDVSAAIAENIIPEILTDIDDEPPETDDEPVANRENCVEPVDSVVIENCAETTDKSTYVTCDMITNLYNEDIHIAATVLQSLGADHAMKKDTNNNNEMATEAAENPLANANTRADEDRVPTISRILENVMEAAKNLTDGGGEKTDSDEDRVVNGVFEPPSTPPNTENEDTEDDL